MMIEVVIKNLTPNCDHQFVFICQESHVREYDLEQVFSKLCTNYQIIAINGVTEGAAVTVLKARNLIDTKEPLMIANSDQWVDLDINEYLEDMDSRNLDGCMLTMTADDPKWSFAKVNSQGYVTEVVEKVVVSDEATVGIYNFKHGEDFCKFADLMISRNEKSNNEFYVAPVYSYMAREYLCIGVFNIGEVGNGMYGLGTPDDLERFLLLDASNKAVKF